MTANVEPGRGSLRGSVVLVTGGSRGIGQAICLRLAKEQPEHVVVGYCMAYEQAQATVAQLKELGVDASAISADLGQVDMVRELFSKIGDRFGRLDVLVSNAARAAFRPVDGLSVRSWQRTMDINARAFLLCGQEAARLMGDRGGRIIAMSSLGSHRYTPGYVALGAAKATVESLARYMAVELAPQGIRVNVVCGGLIDTESMRLHPQYDQICAQVRDGTPAGRVGRVEDLANVVALLCSPDADWICGQTIIADGGFSLTL